MDLLDDAMELRNEMELKNEAERGYSQEEIPVDIGKWLSYEAYHDEEQLALQRENILRLPLENSYGKIGFVLSKYIQRLEDYLEDVSTRVRIENTEVVLETEVYYTSKIEGALTTIRRTQEIHNGSPIREDNKFSEAMIKGNFDAVKLLNLYGNKMDDKILFGVWDVLTTDCRSNREIEGEKYRCGDVGLTGSAFQCVPADLLPDRMGEWMAFYNGKLLDDRPFVKASLLHFAFETIHPFCDGNGRLGRLLMNNYLISRGIESCRAVSFSMQIDANRGSYDGAFTTSENQCGDATSFVEYMLEAMAKSFERAIRHQTASSSNVV